jgi:EmrB/QacA subfamily drug resistance transporter
MSLVAKPPCDEGAVLGAGACVGFAPTARRWTLAAAILGSAMAFVDGSVVNVALPAIQRDLDATAAEMQWVVEAYALFLSSLLLVGGALGDRLGRKAVFMAGVALFTAASLACALAPTPLLLIAARGMQGVGAALLVPGSLSLISAAYPRSERGGAIGTWSALSGAAAAAGPVLGGWLVEHASWTWAFLINLPLGVVLWLLCAWGVPESRNEQAPRRLDMRGATLVTVGLAGVVYAFIQAPTDGWLTGSVLASLGTGMLALGLFVAAEARAAAPMVPLRLFANSDFTGANLLTLLLYAALGGGLYYLPLNLIQVQGYGAAAAGAAMLPFIAIMFLLSRASGRVVDRLGAKLPLVVGPLIAAAGFALLMQPGMGGSYWWTFFPGIVVLGVGMAVTVAPLTTTVMNAVGADLAGVASGINNAVARAASLLAIAIFGIVMAQVFDSRLAALLQELSLPPSLVHGIEQQRARLAGIVLPPGIDAVQQQAVHQAIGGAFVAGFRRVMAVCAGLALLSALCAAWFIGRERRKQ